MICNSSSKANNIKIWIKKKKYQPQQNIKEHGCGYEGKGISTLSISLCDDDDHDDGFPFVVPLIIHKKKHSNHKGVELSEFSQYMHKVALAII